MKTYYKPEGSDEHIHVCKRRTLLIAVIVIIALGVINAFLLRG